VRVEYTAFRDDVGKPSRGGEGGPGPHDQAGLYV
jgi:hypothetical protein